MRFTEYLRQLLREGSLTPLWNCIDYDTWPRYSTRLEDYEAALRRYLVGAQREAIPELRELWAEWREETGKEDSLDLAMAAWRDYALHLRDCRRRGTRPCPRSDALFATAVAASDFQDLATGVPDPFHCDSPGGDPLRQVQQVIDQVCNPSDVKPGVPPAGDRSPPSKSLRRKP